MKQSDDYSKFLEKYGFTLNYSLPHPVFKDQMNFEGLEADYVKHLQREVEHYKNCFFETSSNNERLLSMERYRLNDEVKILRMKDGNE